MKKIVKKTKEFLKKIQEFHKKLQKQAPVEKFAMPEPQKRRKTDEIQLVHLSALSVMKSTVGVIAVVLLAWLLFEVREFLLLFFISLFLSAALDPIVDWFERYKIPRPVSVILIFFFLFAFIIGLFSSIFPLIFEQITSLLTNFIQWIVQTLRSMQDGEMLLYIPENYRMDIINIIKSIDVNTLQEYLLSNFQAIAGQLKDLASGSFNQIGSAFQAGVNITVALASWAFQLSLVLILTFFMIIDKNSLQDFFVALFPRKYGVYVTKKISAIQKQIGAWFRGQIFLSFIMFCITFIGLLIIGMSEYALTLSLVMAIGEFIPYVGPLLFLLFSLPLALGASWGMLVKLIILHLILQFVEGNFLVPAVMNKVVGLSPIVVVLVLLIGFQFLGVVGAMIAVPLTTAVAIFVTDYTRSLDKKSK